MSRSTFGLAVFVALVVCVLSFEKKNLFLKEVMAVGGTEERACSETGKSCDDTRVCCDECYTCKCRTPSGGNCWCDYKRMTCGMGK
nr:venom gland protein U4-PHTX-Pmx1a [Physocyclus mexicanus]